MNRFSRIVLPFEGLAAGQWYEFSACMVCAFGEASAAVKDFAALGLAVRAQDRSEIDVARIPGLARRSVDAHGDGLAGPGAVDGDAGCRTAVIRRCFYLPVPAAEVTIVIRRGCNAHPFRIIDPALRPASPEPDCRVDGGPQGPAHPLSRGGRIVLGTRPTWFRYGLVSGRALVLKGQVIAHARPDGALARIALRDARGSPIPPP